MHAETIINVFNSMMNDRIRIEENAAKRAAYKEAVEQLESIYNIVLDSHLNDLKRCIEEKKEFKG